MFALYFSILYKPGGCVSSAAQYAVRQLQTSPSHSHRRLFSSIARLVTSGVPWDDEPGPSRSTVDCSEAKDSELTSVDALDDETAGFRQKFHDYVQSKLRIAFKHVPPHVSWLRHLFCWCVCAVSHPPVALSTSLGASLYIQ